MSRKHNIATATILYEEKKTRRGRPYSPYITSQKSSSKKSSIHPMPMINNNISIQACEIEQSQLLAEIFEDARQSKRNNNQQQQQQHHRRHQNCNDSKKKVPFHHTAYRDVPSPHESETESNQMDQNEPKIETTNNNDPNPESDEDEVEEEASQTATTDTGDAERSDSVIITGSYTQHDIDLEEITRIRTNGKSCF